MTFNGTSSYIAFGQPASLQTGSFTVEAWVKPTTGNGTVLRSRSNGYALAIDSGGFATVTA